MLVLDRGYWDGYSCLSRAFLQFGISFSIITVVGYLNLLFYSLKIWGQRGFTPNGARVTDRKKLRIVSSVGLMLAALVSAFVASTSSRDLVAVIESKIVERGCLSFHPFEYGFALSEVETTYESHLYGGRGARGLLLKPHGGGKDIGILLERSQYLDNLFQTFPTAMKIYVDNFRNNRVLRPPQQRALAASKRHETEVPQR